MDKKSNTGVFNLWKSNLSINIISGVLLVFMEWLFITTKPSFLTGTSMVEKINVLLVASIFLAVLLTLLSIPAFVISSIFRKQIKVFAHLLSIIPAAVLASLALLLVDNFTYTVFKFGIVNSHGITRGLYLLMWLAFFVVAVRRLAKFVIQNTEKQKKNKIAVPSTILVTVLLVALAVIFSRVPSSSIKELGSLNPNKDLPNIVLFTADGMNAKNMSVYGYERETTPFLDSIKDSLVISKNHFNNAANTSGSITSILTGKYPTVTRVLFPPDVLKGNDSFEHLPAILRDLGYYSSQLTVQHYVDASKQNLQNSFDESNGVSLRTSSITNYLNSRFPGNGVLFIKEVEGRLLSRLKHIFFIKAMENTYAQITDTQKDFKDLEKISGAVDLITQKDQPVFVEIHWMGTHGDKFFPASSEFSSGIDRSHQESWNTDLYDDAIVDVDSGLGMLFQGLEAAGELDSTLIIITSDHGERLSTIDRIPMIIHLPGGVQRVITATNSQHIDIAPTILDVLGQTQPSWMTPGQSIFDKSYVDGLVLSVGTSRAEDKSGKGQWTLKEDYFTPPFYQFDYMTVIDCDRYYRLNLEKLSWSNGVVPLYEGRCAEQNYASKTDIRAAMINRLVEDGFEFDQSTIPEIP